MDLKILRKIIRDALLIDCLDVPKCDVLTFASDSNRSFEYNGKAYSPLMSTVEDDLSMRGLTCTSVSRIASVLKGDKAHGFVISPEGSFARALISKRFKKLLTGRRYPFSFAEEKIWDRLLEQSGAGAVIGIMPSRELCRACKRRNIWVADLQHGVIALSHPWYDPRQRLKEPAEWAPDAFLVWDEGAAAALASWVPQKGGDIHVVGNPWTTRFQEIFTDDELVLNAVSRYPAERKTKPQIVVSLSWGIKNIPNGFIHPSLESVMLDTEDRYAWHIRLHPNQLNGFAEDESRSFISYYKHSFNGTSVKWKMATEMPLPLLLSRTDLHITWSSSVCIEAANFGIRSLLLDPDIFPNAEKGDYFNYLVETGYADKGRPEYGQILRWLNKNIEKNSPDRSGYRHQYEAMLDGITQMALEK